MLNTLAAFGRAYIFDKPLPKLAWKHAEIDGKVRLTVTSRPAPKAARLWHADASTRDFRKSTWTAEELNVGKETVVGEATAPASGCRVFYIECEYEQDGLVYYLSTQLRIIGKPETKDKKARE